MFKVNTSETFKRKIVAKVPVDGGFRDDWFGATFRVLPLDEANSFDLATTEGTTGFLQATIVELHDIADADGNDLPYSDAVRDQVLQLPFVRRVLADAYLSAIAAQPSK
jgi:hypothetical protein